MFIEQPPWLFRALYPQAIFRMDPNERAVYLTFDDGPIPEVTPWVLEILEKHHIKATFFMVGDNIRKHPDEYRMVVEHGHRIGNHTFNHIRGFEYSNPDYLANARKVMEQVKNGEKEYHLIEVMACRRGCIMGGGQPTRAGDRTKSLRAKGLYNADNTTIIKKSDENPLVVELYNGLLKGKEHHLLHNESY